MLTVTTRPTTQICTLEALKQRLRVDHDDDDDDLEMLLEAATGFFEKATGKTLRPTSFRLDLPRFCGGMRINAFPVRAVTSLSYEDGEGETIIVDPGEYEFVPTSYGGFIRFYDAWSAPNLYDDFRPAHIAFNAGFDAPNTTEGALPLDEKLVFAVMSLVAHWYQNREAAMPDDLTNVPLHFKAIAEQERIFR